MMKFSNALAYAVVGIVALLIAWMLIAGMVNSLGKPDQERDNCSAAYARVGECP